jgi:hypothetical protein
MSGYLHQDSHGLSESKSSHNGAYYHSSGYLTRLSISCTVFSLPLESIPSEACWKLVLWPVCLPLGVLNQLVGLRLGS